MHQQEKKLIKGFTLLEVLVVLSIIAIISTAAYQPFQDWRIDRQTRLAAEKIRDMLVTVNGQVQRGLYGFAQFYVQRSEDGGYLFQTNGMLMNNLATNISEIDDWHTTSVRCKNDDAFWDHLGASNNRAEVRSFEIDNLTTSINTPSGICFSILGISNLSECSADSIALSCKFFKLLILINFFPGYEDIRTCFMDFIL